ncbi:hypothetical protein BGZ94_009032 [Podila epigama]|nr:hypothetical protein BGZ94_009032 [Podila epigama]
MSDQPTADPGTSASQDASQDPSSSPSLPSLTQSTPVVIAPQSETSVASSPAQQSNHDMESVETSATSTATGPVTTTLAATGTAAPTVATVQTTAQEGVPGTDKVPDVILSDIVQAAAANTSDLLLMHGLPVDTSVLLGQSQAPIITPPASLPEPLAASEPSTITPQQTPGPTSSALSTAITLSSTTTGQAQDQNLTVNDKGSRQIGSEKAPENESFTSNADGSVFSLMSTTRILQKETISTPPLPWQDLLINMLNEIGYVETSRMMSAEDLVLSLKQRGKAPGIISNYMKQIQASLQSSLAADSDKGPGASKRHNSNSESSTMMDIDGQEPIKRRRVDDNSHFVQMDATRDEIESKMQEFISVKREQINESNRQEFIKGHQTHQDPSAQPSAEDDDGCARVDARKLNRTIQMRLETVKNEALTKTNPKNVVQANDIGDINGLDERLRNIQVHLNLRFAATPTCTLAERIRIVEDVIIQLEREYPLWSALHFNQPNRSFPPPPSVTTVSRNARNQIVLSGDHMATTIIENGDPLPNGGAPGSAGYSSYGLVQGASSAGTGGIPSRGGAASRVTPAMAGRVPADANGPDGAAVPAGARRGVGTTAATPATAAASPAGSATVIKLKRHGGVGSSSLARAVQQQLAQRKAAAGGVLSTDEAKAAGSTAPTFKMTTSSFDEPFELGSSSNLAKSGPGAARISSAGTSPGSSLSPTIGFPDPSKPGVTGRGPIKSRRKSIAKGLDPASALASMNVGHAGGGHILGTHPGVSLTGSPMGSPSGQKHNAAGGVAGGPGATTASGTTKSKAGGAAKKPRKKKGDEGEGDGATAKGSGAQATVGRGRGYGLGKGKSGRPVAMGLGLGKGKGGAYRDEILRRAEVEEFDDDDDNDDDDGDGSDDDMDDFDGAGSGGGGNNGTMTHHPNPLAAPGAHVRNMALANAAIAAANNRAAGAGAGAGARGAGAGAVAGAGPSPSGGAGIGASAGTRAGGDNEALSLSAQQQQAQQQQQQQVQQQHHHPSQEAKAKKRPQKSTTPAKPPAIRKFGGKSFGMAGGESSDSNESSDGDGSGSSGSQSDTSSSGSISGSDPGDSD